MISNFDSVNSLIINYFLRYDFFSKYNLNSIYKIPKLEKISLEIFSNDILKVYEVEVDKSDIEVQLTFFFAAYIINGTIPFINFSKTKRLNEAFFWLKVFFFSYNEKLMFLRNLLVEKRFQQVRLISKEKDNFMYKYFDKKKFIFKVRISMVNFLGMKKFFTNYFPDINLDRLWVELSFFFNQSFLKYSELYYSNVLRNILLMWEKI